MSHIQKHYQTVQSRLEKCLLLTEISRNLNCRRKHAIRLMNGKIVKSEKLWRRRENIYPERLVRILENIWEISQNPWSVRLKELLPLWLVWIRKHWKLTPEEERQLLRTQDLRQDQARAVAAANHSHPDRVLERAGAWVAGG